MTNHVQKLAAVPCPECKGDKTIPLYQTGGMPVGDIPTWVDCPACYGTGALVPGLRRVCPEQHHFCSQPNCGKIHCKACQGCGWVLIPAAEQMGVLVRGDKGRHTIGYGPDGGWFIRQSHTPYFLVVGAKGYTPEEALAIAICQDKGITR